MDRVDTGTIMALRGPKGDPGVGVQIDGIATHTSELPVSPFDNEQWLVGDDLHMFIDGAWVNYGPIRGPQGPQGVQGIQGVAGPIGPQGPVGPQGPQGTKGDPGTGLSVLGVKSGSAELPVSGDAGDAWLVPGSGGINDVWFWDTSATTWVNGGQLQGPIGPQGPAGAKGDTGPAGPVGASGPIGSPGPKGDKGDTGTTGSIGPAGPPNMLQVGTVDSTTGGPSVEIVGDPPNQTVNFLLKEGPQGPQGLNGPQGIQGLKGDKGDPGVGMVAGGSSGQVLRKASGVNHDAVWSEDIGAAFAIDAEPRVAANTAAISRVDPGGTGAPGQVLQHGASGPEWQSKAIYDIRDLVSDTTGATVVTSELQGALDALPDGATLSYPAGTVLNLDNTITINKKMEWTGMGELRWTAGPDNYTGVRVMANGTKISSVSLTNPNELASSATGPKPAIRVQANFVTISSAFIDRWNIGVMQDAEGEYFGLIVNGNMITNIIGVGSESKGDGVICIGAGAVITNNIITAKTGTDARIGIVIEDLPTYIVTPLISNGFNVSDSRFVVTGNIITGPFRRSIHAEGVKDFVIAHNVCDSARWWGMMIWKCVGGVIESNMIRWLENGTTGPGTTYRTPFYCQLSRQVSILNNTITVDSGTTLDMGMYISGATSGTPSSVTVEGNTFLNTNAASVPALYVINMHGEISTFRRNKFRGAWSKAGYFWTSATSGTRSAELIWNDNDMRSTTGSTIGLHVVAYKRVFAEGNYIAVAGMTTAMRLENTDFALAAHNKLSGMATGVDGTGSVAVYAPNNTYLSAMTKTVGVTSTTAYGA